MHRNYARRCRERAQLNIYIFKHTHGALEVAEKMETLCLSRTGTVESKAEELN